MALAAEEIDVILLVEDEDSVRKTFCEWLEHENLGCRILSAPDAESALVLANRNPVDLAILDWNLGAGNDGLQLLEDLSVFHPDIVAILVTGFAHQATPLHAMRMGVRDYLDKNHDLDRTTFLNAVERQLTRIRPAKRQRQFHQGLVAFREALDKILPITQSTNALNNFESAAEAISQVVTFFKDLTNAKDGVLFVRQFDASQNPPEICQVFGGAGQLVSEPAAPFAHSLAGAVVSMDEARILRRLGEPDEVFEWQPFEKGRKTLLAAPLKIGSAMQAVIELFDKQDASGTIVASGFTESDRCLVRDSATLASALLRQTFSQRQNNQLLLNAVTSALKTSDSLAQPLKGTVQERMATPLPDDILVQFRKGLASTGVSPKASEEMVQLAEAIRVLGLRYGAAGLRHSRVVIDQVRELLDEVQGISPADSR